MNPIELYHRMLALKALGERETNPEQVRAYLREMREIFATQCIRCFHSADDPKHQPRRRLWWSRRPECAYLPRLPDHMHAPGADEGMPPLVIIDEETR